ncbi:hypothetical protein NPIL_248421 [Nephila pilipes]|uniref:Uncharacterized protein n=1 Tax=Nephila pilipes TaxID=299642 RepID=A0A8X6Q7L5_NEPPI|nr:hypothetical protein NPIL_248421 [Nephila pilipes]
MFTGALDSHTCYASTPHILQHLCTQTKNQPKYLPKKIRIPFPNTTSTEIILIVYTPREWVLSTKTEPILTYPLQALFHRERKKKKTLENVSLLSEENGVVCVSSVSSKLPRFFPRDKALWMEYSDVNSVVITHQCHYCE